MDSSKSVVLRSVAFYEDVLEAVQIPPDNKVYVSLRRCCEGLSVDFAS